MDERLLVGIDGGGTYTKAVAARPDGTVVSMAQGPGINYNNIGVKSARENLRTLLAGMPQVAGHGIRRICAGLSALDAPASQETIAMFAGDAFDPATLDLQSDAYIALMGLTLGGPGLIIICGTGSMLLAVDAQGNQHVMGGWGYLLGDTGSSHALAVEGLRAAIDGWEGVGKPTALMQAALNHYNVTSPRALIDRIYAPEETPASIAQFAREVLRLQASDAMAAGIVARQMEHVALQASQLMNRSPEIRQVGLYGGIFAHNPKVYRMLEQMLLSLQPAASIATPPYPPELGALIYLFRQSGTLTADVLARMQESYETHKVQYMPGRVHA